MAEPTSQPGAVSGWFRGYLYAGVRTIIAACLVGFLSMALSFLVIYAMSGMGNGEAPIDPKALQDARLLRTFSNELVTLCNAYHGRIEDGLNSVDRTWVERTFRRDIQFLQERMDDTMSEDSMEFLQLRAAVSRCATMSKNPEDAVLRRRTLDEVGRAVEKAEARIHHVVGGSHAGPPRVKVRFM